MLLHVLETKKVGELFDFQPIVTIFGLNITKVIP